MQKVWPILAMAAALGFSASASPASVEPSKVEDLGEGRLRLGKIEVDTKEFYLRIPGRIIRQDVTDSPMEFVAVTTGGMKSYEAVLELDTTAMDFNLACILIGLDETKARRPKYHFDPEETLGEPVSVTVSFNVEGSEKTLPAEQLLANHEKTGPHQWVYTGSSFTADGTYLAESMGTLIGVVHDPESIIQHKKGIGLGNYGEVVIDAKVVPPPDTPVVITVRRL